MKIIHISIGGPVIKISIKGKLYHFEDHRYCGPMRVDQRGEPTTKTPMAFWKAVSLWAQQGRKIENGLAVWYHEREPILEHLGGRNWRITGYKEAVRGE
jgi:hypothetical protein